MKNTLLKTAVSAALLSISYGAHADGTITAGATGASTAIGTGTGAGNCELLQVSVTANVSPNVEVAWSCNATGNTIGVAACHPNGRKGSNGTDSYMYSGGSDGGAVSAPTTPSGACSSTTTAAAATTAAGSSSTSTSTSSTSTSTTTGS